MFNEIERHLHDLRRRELSFKAGQHLFRLGDRVRAMHFVQAGAVHLVRHQSDGSALILQRAAAGSILAEASLYSDTYHCDAMSIAPTRTLAFDKADLRRRFLASPEFAEAWASALARELQRTRLQAEILSLKTVAARLDAWIGCNDRGLSPKGEWRQVASQIGVSPEALYREIGKRHRKIARSR